MKTLVLIFAGMIIAFLLLLVGIKEEIDGYLI